MAKKKTTKKKAAKKGRPTIITEKHIEDVTTAIQSGAYIESAAAFAGIHKDTFYAWLKRGARALAAVYSEKTGLHNRKRIPVDERPYVAFSDAIKKAMGESELFDLGVITKAAKDGAWQASAWRLERKYPDRWGRKAHGKITLGEGEVESGKNGVPATPAPDDSVGALDPRNPGELHITLAIGDKEIAIDDVGE